MGRKQKYNLEFKLRIVAIILEGKNSIKGLARVENISDSNIHYWLKVYETYGEQGLLGIRQSSFTLEEKVNIIQEHQNTGLSLMD
ncbi:transposase, partial [Myroides marinus]